MRSALVVLIACGCQPMGQNPLSLEHDWAVAPAPSTGERQFGLTTGDGPNQSHLVFLNFAGGTINPSSNGYQDDSAKNQSWMAKSTRTMPAFDATPYKSGAIDAVVAQYKAFYAAYNVSVSTTRPSSGRYLMVMIGGSPADLEGGSNNTSEAGVSPLDCGNMEESNIAFVFSNALAPKSTGFPAADALMQVAADAAHESGHSFGLEHVTDKTDVMYPVLEPTITGFHGSSTLSDGSSTCGSGSKQDTAGLLLSNIGPASSQPVTTPPTVSFTSPTEGANVGLTFDVVVAATAASGATITKVELSENSNVIATLTSAPYHQSLMVTSAGAVVLTATAYDNAGQSTAVTVHFNADSSSPTPSMSPAPSTTPTPSMPPATTGKPNGASCTRGPECQSGMCYVTDVGVCVAASTSGGRATTADGGCNIGGAPASDAVWVIAAALALLIFRRRRTV